MDTHGTKVIVLINQVLLFQKSPLREVLQYMFYKKTFNDKSSLKSCLVVAHHGEFGVGIYFSRGMLTVENQKGRPTRSIGAHGTAT